MSDPTFEFGGKPRRRPDSCEYLPLHTRPLRRGGLGELWLAHHHQFTPDRVVALKIARTAVVPGDESRTDTAATEHRDRLLAAEARALGAIKHPNVVEVLYYGGPPEHPNAHLVMEFLSGLALPDFLAHWRPPGSRTGACPNIARAVDLLAQCCDGVEAMHRAGFLHNDLKPDNLMICDCGDRAADRAKVIDLGLASPLCPAGAPGLPRQLGTKSHMAPERFSEARAVDARSDVYSLGCVAYLLFTGAPLFSLPPGTGASDWAIRHKIGARPKLTDRNPQVPHRLSSAVLRAVLPDPGDRYSTAEQFGRALRACRPAPGSWTPQESRAWWDADPIKRRLIELREPERVP